MDSLSGASASDVLTSRTRIFSSMRSCLVYSWTVKSDFEFCNRWWGGCSVSLLSVLLVVSHVVLCSTSQPIEVPQDCQLALDSMATSSIAAAASQIVSRTVQTVRRASKNRQWGGYIKVIDPGMSLSACPLSATPFQDSGLLVFLILTLLFYTLDYKDVDPFIFLVHHVHSFPAGAIEGFSAHPHRGFETGTLLHS